MWHAWICFHPLERDDDADRMDTRYATSRDGLTWSFPTIASKGHREVGMHEVPGLQQFYEIQSSLLPTTTVVRIVNQIRKR